MPRPSAPRVDAAQRDARALELRAAGASFRQIAERLGVSVSTAWAAVERGLDRTRREPADHLRILEAERLDRLQAQATLVLQSRHVVVQGGQVVKGDDGLPLADHGPTLAAIRTLVQVMERRARMEGLDAPQRHDIKLADQFYSPSALEAELERIRQELAADDPEWAERERRQQAHERAREQFRAEWSTPGRIAHNPAKFIGDGLALLLDGLDLDDQAKEAAAVEVERALWTKAAP